MWVQNGELSVMKRVLVTKIPLVLVQLRYGYLILDGFNANGQIQQHTAYYDCFQTGYYDILLLFGPVHHAFDKKIGHLILLDKQKEMQV